MTSDTLIVLGAWSVGTVELMGLVVVPFYRDHRARLARIRSRNVLTSVTTPAIIRVTKPSKLGPTERTAP